MDNNQVLWHSRRGMLELDLLLEPFARDRYGSLSDDLQRDYRELLRCEDQALYEILMRRTTPPDHSLGPIIDEILSFAASTKH